LNKFLQITFPLLLLILYIPTAVQADIGRLPSLAVYYADHVPVQELAQFDRIVVEADHVDALQLKGLEKYGGRVHAYVSVGEAESWRSDYRDMKTGWFIGRNPSWNTDITDLANPDYREFLLSKRFKPLLKRGFRAFFLDTLDSYQGIDQTTIDWQAQEQGLVTLIQDLKTRFPDADLILNRGFPALSHVKELIHGVVVESLFRAWNPRNGEYYTVKTEERDWLLDELLKARDQYGLAVYSIDYVPAKERNLARKTAKKIADLGISPWVTVPEHDAIGMGLKEVIPRRVLMIHEDESDRRDIEGLAVVLDYFGYIPVYHDIHQPLPPYRMLNRYAGIVSWLYDKGPADYENWLEWQVTDGVRIVMLAHPGVSKASRLLKSFGLTQTEISYPCRVVEHDNLYGFETRNDVTAEPLTDLKSTDSANIVHVRGAGKQGKYITPVVTGPWGGMALDPWLRSKNRLMADRWIIDPFALIKIGLALPDVPMPDVTTENGHRIWMSHIDGDGFLNRAELPGTPYSAEVIRTRILKKYNLPTTVSIIEGEIGPTGLYPKQSSQLEKIARAIFRLPKVELASHTYSHPFNWVAVEKGVAVSGEYSLPIPRYKYTLEREIIGSVDYINTQLAPPGKRVKVLLWTGDCLPSEKAIRISREAGLYNLNGGDTTIRKSHPYLSRVTPITRPKSSELQLYAPIMNENVYTNLWRGPFYGFRHVIETFKLTDHPRRLKPIDIYYHFYSGEKTASLRALEEVYDWTLKQEIMPLYVSDFAERVLAYQEATVARDLNGHLTYQAPSHLRSLRQVGKKKTSRYSPAENVAGFRQLHDGTYYALAGKRKTKLVRKAIKEKPILLVRANGSLRSWEDIGGKIKFSVKGHQPLSLVIDGPGPCRLTVGRRVLIGKPSKEGWLFRISRQHLEGAEVVCR
jgi:hypothetical protein